MISQENIPAIISVLFGLLSGGGFLATWYKMKSERKQRDAESLGVYMEKTGKVIIDGFKDLAEESGRRAQKTEDEFNKLWEQHKTTKEKLSALSDKEEECQKIRRELEEYISKIESKLADIESLPVIVEELKKKAKNCKPNGSLPPFEAPANGQS